VASLEECERAVQDLAERLAEMDPELRGRYAADRTVACHVPDLGFVFLGRVDADGLQDVHTAPDGSSDVDKGDAQVRLATSSDDLVALLEGRLPVPTAWATGRLKVEASVLDLLKLRSLL
jgi:predicted lipid carrier protein YhbT